jgi:hypothetical protein
LNSVREKECNNFKSRRGSGSVSGFINLKNNDSSKFKTQIKSENEKDCSEKFESSKNSRKTPLSDSFTEMTEENDNEDGMELKSFKVADLENHNQIVIEELFDCFEQLFNQERPQEKIATNDKKNDDSENKSIFSGPSTFNLDMPSLPLSERISKFGN